MSQVTVPTSRTKKGAVMQLLPKLPPKSSGAHQFFSYMIYHVNHVFVFTVVVLIILKYITPKNGLCHYLKITVLRNLHAKTSQRHLSNFFPQFPRPTESSRTESSRYGIFAKRIFAIGIFAIGIFAIDSSREIFPRNARFFYLGFLRKLD